MSSLSNIKEQIENELSTLVGERIRRFIRAALMVGIDFGEDIVEYIASNQSKVNTYKFSLHIQSSWRLLKYDDICLSQSALFSCMHGFRWCEDNESVLFILISKELNKIFEIETIKVIKIEATEIGDFKLYMENGYCLEVFVDSIGDTESWRFMRNSDDSSHSNHFVIFDEE